jgi:hypothetical protein
MEQAHRRDRKLADVVHSKTAPSAPDQLPEIAKGTYAMKVGSFNRCAATRFERLWHQPLRAVENPDIENTLQRFDPHSLHIPLTKRVLDADIENFLHGSGTIQRRPVAD